MFNVLIWDHTGDSPKWLERYIDKNAVKVIKTITPTELIPEVLLQSDSWDWLLIFERGMRKDLDTTLKTLKLPLEKVVYALDGNSWAQNPKAVYTLLSESSSGANRRWVAFKNCQAHNNFIACTVNDCSYVATAKDDVIMRNMFLWRNNWASSSMKRFHELSQKYYNIDGGGEGIFLELGANIGTTGIYFLKNLAPDLNLLAFEPDTENFKLLRINTILNDLEDRATLVNCGLGDKADELILYRGLTNPGGNSILKPGANRPTETIKVIALDSYFAENKIPAAQIKYIWIDTEGFEAQVIVGMKNLLKENPAPIFMECNLGAWDNSGLFEDMLALLAENYSHFILFPLKGKEELYPLETLRTLERAKNVLGQIGDIFLIRKGAID